jgi:hypothetical protein
MLDSFANQLKVTTYYRLPFASFSNTNIGTLSFRNGTIGLL